MCGKFAYSRDGDNILVTVQLFMMQGKLPGKFPTLRGSPMEGDIGSQRKTSWSSYSVVSTWDLANTDWDQPKVTRIQKRLCGNGQKQSLGQN